MVCQCCAVLACIWTLYYSVALHPLSSAISCLIKLAPLPPFLSIEFSCLSFKVVYCDKRQENTAQTASIHHFWDVSVLSCRRSRPGVTPIWGRPEHRSKTSRRTLGMGWNSCSCWRSSQVKSSLKQCHFWAQRGCWPAESLNLDSCQKPEGKMHKSDLQSCQSDSELRSDIKD